MGRKKKSAAAARVTSTSGSPVYRDRKQPVDLARALVEGFLVNDRINHALIDLVKPDIWRSSPPCASRKNIATTFAHIHNVRCMKLRMSSRDKKAPARLDRGTATPAQARRALGESAAAMVRLIEESLDAGGHVRDFRPDVVAFVLAACTHDAYHRGQICHWARQLGAPIEPERELLLWEWDKRWLEIRD